MKKVLCTVLALAMALALLAGCGGAPASSGSTAASGSAGNAENATIKVAALVSGYENTYPGMWQEVCDAFTAQTGINVELTLEQNLEDVLNASMQGGDYPDVIHLATGRPAGLTEQFINGKMIADITDVLDMTVPGEDVKVGDKIDIPNIGTVEVLANDALVAGQETAAENNGVVLLPERVVFTAENVADYNF